MIPGIVSVQSVSAGGPLRPALWPDADVFPSTVVLKPTKWNPSTVVNVTLSNGDTTATHSNSTNNSGVHSFDNKSTGKYYFEVTMTTIHGDFDCCGIFSGFSFTDFVTNALSCTKIDKKLGNIWSNDNNVTPAGALGVIASGDVINIAIDLSARKAWFRKNGFGDWNGNATHNPSTGAGGVTIKSGPSFEPAVGFGGTGTAAGDTMTAKFALFAFPVPTGFVFWPG